MITSSYGQREAEVLKTGAFTFRMMCFTDRSSAPLSSSPKHSVMPH